MPAFIYEISDYEILIATLSKVLVTRHEYLTILILYSIKFISLYLPMLYSTEIIWTFKRLNIPPQRFLMSIAFLLDSVNFTWIYVN